jgi:PAS domain S-box-containing protein
VDDAQLTGLSDALATLTEHQANGTEPFADRLRGLLETVSRALRVRRVSLWRFAEGRRGIHCVDLYDAGSGRHDCGSMLARADFPAYFAALETERLVAAADARTDARTREFCHAYLAPHGIGAMLDVPLRHEGVAIGVLCLEHVGAPRAWTPAEQNFAISAANVVATATAYEERQVALTRLAQSEARLYSIINTAHDAFVGANSAGEIVEWNAQAVATFGWSREEVLGRPLADTIIPATYREAHLAGLRRFHESGAAPLVNQRLELTALHKDGHEFPIEITITQPLRAESGYFFGAFLRDISVRRQADEELRRTRDAAEAATRAKSEFLANMSHELRTPLNGVLGYAQLLLRDPQLTPSQREGVQTIAECGSYLLELINDVLDLSRIEAGRLANDPQPTDLRELLADLERVVGPAAGRKGLALQLEAAAPIPALVMLDARHLRQVLLNLVGNAIKFTGHGSIRVTLGAAPNGRLLAEVVDTGPGIAPEHLGAIFEAFRQTQTGAAAGGTGLGLTISQRLVRAMGGTIAVESTPGAGSRFFFSLPLVPASADAMARRTQLRTELGADARLMPGVRVRGLVADDNAVSRQVLASLLESAGVEVITAAGGLEAVEHARRFQPDIVFMDRRMPDLDGLEATRRIRADARTCHIPVVAVSASAFTDSPEAAREAGCVDFLPKPIRAEALFAVLQRHLAVALVSGGTPPLDAAGATAPLADAPADRVALGRRLRAAVTLGDITAIDTLTRELAAAGTAAPLARQLADLKAAFDFDGLRRLADWLEGQDA